jgi:NAD(P)-dependent dehydrogenase (short-subunit alcohol dehydrogenase family)
MGRLDGKVAVITGAASGIGRGTAEVFAEEGAKVVIADRDEERGGRLAERLGSRASFIRTDVAQGAEIRRAVEHAVQRFGRLDIMYNNAGFGGARDGIAELTEEGWDATMAVLLRAVFLGMKYAAAVMKPQRSGVILSTASVAGLTTAWSTPHIYNTAKAAVVQLTKSVALELGEYGIRVNCLCPGFIATPIVAGGLDMPSQLLDKVPDVAARYLANLQPLKRAGRPDDIAQAALWLASDAAEWVTGHALVVDGGVMTGSSWKSVLAPLRDELRALAGEG